MNSKIYSTYKLALLVISLSLAAFAHAQGRFYQCEFGVQGGVGYYVGDASQHIFLNPREVFGGQFRYKFTNRWALSVKGEYQHIKFKYSDYGRLSDRWAENNITKVDVVGEFNFFRFGEHNYDRRYKPLTPYIFLGVGAAVYTNYSHVGVYMPFGFGMKWHFAPRWGLNLQWQHQLFFADNIEGVELLDNTYKLNGSNILNNDLTGEITLGIVFEFARKRSACRTCDD